MTKLYLSSVLLFAVQLPILSHHTTIQNTIKLPGQSIQISQTSDFSKFENTRENVRHRVWLNLTNTEGLFKQILIGYMAGATNGWDQSYDAVSADANKYADFYSVNEGKKLVIQARAVPMELSDTIPLGYRSAITGDLTISIDHADGDLTNQDIYLQDVYTGVIHNLRDGDYTFSTQTGIFNDRFILRYSDQKLDVKGPGIAPKEFTVASRNKVITLRSATEQLSDVSVFDITGKLLYSCKQIGSNNLEISNIQAGMQILLVKTKLENGNTITKKVLF